MRGKSPRQAQKPSRTRLMKLEPRILLDAAAAAEASQDMTDSSAQQWSALPESATSSVASQSSSSHTPTLTGTASAGGTLAVTVDGTTYTEDDGQLSREGDSWSLQIPESEALADGVYDVTTTLTDALGQTTEASGELLIDSSTSVSIANDGYITNDSTLTFSGQAEAGDSVAVSLNGVLLDTVTADAQGNWSLDYSATPLADGSYSLEVEATDALGNTDTASWAVTVASTLGDEQVDSYNSLLAAAKTSAIEQIQTYLGSATDAELFALFAGDLDQADTAWSERLSELRATIADGSFFSGLQIQLLDSGELGESVAAYSADGLYGEPTIFVNADWVSLLGSDSLATVLIEEYGHHLDHLLNGDQDSAGDEGQRFAIQVTGSSSDLGSDDDHGTLELNGESLAVEHASFLFTNAYVVNTDSTPASREQNSVDFIYTSTVASVSISNGDASSSSFSGNDVLAIALTVNGTTYYGWISRPIKENGDVKGFYFWSDPSFISQEAAQLDGNKDGDGDATNNLGFILVVDQSYFDSLGWAYPDSTDPLKTDLKNVGTSSDRVDTALNELLANDPPVAVADTASATEAGGLNNATLGSDATGNVLSNDTDPNTGDTKTVTLVSTSTVNTAGTTVETIKTVATGSTSTSNGTAVTGQYGTLTIGADGSYTYVVDNSNTTVEALLPGDTLSETFTYTMADGGGATATTTLTITINGANDTPVAVNDYNTAKESVATSNNYTTSDTTGSTATGNVLNNDTDVDSGDTKTIVGVTATATAGTLTTSSTIDLTFTAATTLSPVNTGDYVYINISGTYYRLNDSAGNQLTVLSKTASSTTAGTYDIVLSGTPASYGSAETPFTITAAGNTIGFSGKAGDTSTSNSLKVSTVSNVSTVTAYTLPLSGITGTIATGMSVTWSSGTATVTGVTYDTSGNVTGITLSSPVSIDTTNLPSGTALTFSGAAGSTLTGHYGTLQLNADGSYVYTPFIDNPNLAAGEQKVDTFTYTMQDTAGAQSSATLAITVTGSDTAYTSPDAKADTVTATEAGGTNNGTAGVDPVGNVITGIITTSSGGTGAADTSGTKLLTASTSSGTSDSLYTATAGTITAKGGNTFTITGEMGSIAVGDILYSYSGTITTYTVTAVSGTSVTVSSSLPNNVAEGTALNLLFVKPTTSSVTLTGLYGTLVIKSDGSYTYTVDNTNATVQALHDSSDTLQDVFTYTISNGAYNGSTLLTDSTTLTITIQGANDAPVAHDDIATANEAALGVTGYNPSGNVLSNDTDVDDLASALRVSALSTGSTTATLSGTVSSGTYTLAGTYGTLTMDTDGTWSYVLNETALANINAGDTRYDTFNYTVTDSSGSSSGLSDTAVLTITINPATDTVSVNNVFVNEASPYAVFTVTGTEGTSVSLALTTATTIGSTSTGITALDNTATLGTDTGTALEYWDSTSGTWLAYSSSVTMPAGGTLYVRVAINNDSTYEGNEVFALVATANSVAAVGLGTINDEGAGDTFSGTNHSGVSEGTGTDDDRPTISVSSPTVTEGGYAVFTVSLDKASWEDLGFIPELTSGTATIGTDTDAASTLQVSYNNGSTWTTVTGAVKIAAGQTSLQLRIATTDDSSIESSEQFTLSTGYIDGTVTNASGATGTATINDNVAPVLDLDANDSSTATGADFKRPQHRRCRQHHPGLGHRRAHQRQDR